MRKNNYCGLEAFSASYPKLRFGQFSSTSEEQKYHFADPEFPTYFERKSYSDNFGSEVFPIRIVHEPGEEFGNETTINESGSNFIGELDFLSSKAKYCLYLPHSWGGRTSPPKPRN